ncbi:hypothetical protein ASF40_19830 [Microbacterium sp. Leaf288]|uniref:heme-degrading domain-containing protein n=1 Tax=Microbacterium sp. Leaf288 TaxID=1736323 RepID=UPI0006FAFA78|nr:heme-binding protein [Microbacterium sp. Leaf288]KQP68038.1 hypothetical protein ASF40_19830 [Microbacterium sp. Leaf288]
MPDTELDDLVQEEWSLSFPRFTHDDARAVGGHIVGTATDGALAITTAIWLGEQRVFHAAMRGTSADNDAWMERKAALTRRYDASSWIVTSRLRRYGVTEAKPAGGLDPMRYVLAGGAVPIRVAGTTVGVAVVSGLSDAEDHALVIDALRSHLATRRASTGDRS